MQCCSAGNQLAQNDDLGFILTIVIIGLCSLLRLISKSYLSSKRVHYMLYDFRISDMYFDAMVHYVFQVSMYPCM